MTVRRTQKPLYALKYLFSAIDGTVVDGIARSVGYEISFMAVGVVSIAYAIGMLVFSKNILGVLLDAAAENYEYSS